ncbi:MAG: DUF6484 domain-containing protein [Gammaproteobacteria bacterium]|nr:DUF6484 domain-containing protein [Gammaproteobacteria bacterium]MDH5652750.1 DUF6484 domain-containing protein [Gammaproteobacteria bacterium]
MKQNEDSQGLETETVEVSSGKITPGEIVIGSLAGIDTAGSPLVNFSGNPAGKPLSAVTTIGVDHTQVGRQVALLFANGDLNSPVIIGLIHSQLHDLLATYQTGSTAEEKEVEEKAQETTETSLDDVVVDGKRVVIEGKEEIVLKCGDASIVLTKSGKILIRGKYLLNRSTGVNRIMGGSVQVN